MSSRFVSARAARALGPVHQMILVLAVTVSGLGLPDAARAGGNYLIVTAPDYQNSAALNEFIAHKQALGFTTSVYAPNPGATRDGIKGYIAGLWGTGNAPDYILIVGDTDGATSTASTIPHWVGQGSRNATTDLPYACMDGANDWYPDIFIGRFPVRTTAQLQAMVTKSKTVENGTYDDPNYVLRAAFLATSDSTAQAPANHDWVISTYLEPLDYVPTRIYAAQGGGTADITAAVNNGCIFVTYFGHSGSSGWSEPSYYQSHVSALANAGKYGLVMGWSCNTAHFDYDECFGETWVRSANKGAAAYLSASNYVWWGSIEAWESSRRMERYFYQSFFVDDIWEVGPAWQAALWRILADPDFGPTHDHTRNIFEEMVLLGDPALLLPKPSAFALDVDPLDQRLCVPPVLEAVYTINVTQSGEFADNVVLSVADLPLGTTAAFDLNDLVPPFVAHLTVQNLGVAPPGGYTLTLRGESHLLTRVAQLGLHIANAPPDRMTLSSPADGAIDVSRTPTLGWEADGAAAEYTVQVATDSAFATIVYTADTEDTSHAVTLQLQPGTFYYWRVQGRNGCGDGDLGPPFSFRTLEQGVYFTQLFTSGFDLDNFSLEFTPDGSGNYYSVCGRTITALPTDPTGGQTLTMTDDSSSQITPGAPVSLYGVSYGSVYVNANGNLTFNSGDGTWQESYAVHFNRPRISALFEDLDPGAGGIVSWKNLANRVVVTFYQVPLRSTTNQNTFQIEMFYNGTLHLSWLRVDCNTGLVGLSAGGGTPGDFLPDDLSAAPGCNDSGFEIAVLPAEQDACVPAEPAYGVQVGLLGTYGGNVILTATGQPAGTTVTFSPNNLPPPFNATMTVQNTAAAAPGTYIIQVTGTGPGLVVVEQVTLRLATAAPGGVLLTSPPDGATGVALAPQLTWQAAAQAATYEVEIATDPDFTQVTHAATVAATSWTVTPDLAPWTTFWWHVRAMNACGDGAFSPAFTFSTPGILTPTAYDMVNGQGGTYTYYDDTYSGNGNPTVPLSPLSGGLGDLTNGVIATGHWNAMNLPYVGWVSVDPVITFHFPRRVRLDEITVYMDDNGGGGGVHVPTDITLVMHGQNRVYYITDPAGNGPFGWHQAGLNLAGATLALTPADHSTSGYIMLSEIEFIGHYVMEDLDADGYVDMGDFELLATCLNGPEGAMAPGCDPSDLDGDHDADLADMARFQPTFSGAQ